MYLNFHWDVSQSSVCLKVNMHWSHFWQETEKVLIKDLFEKLWTFRKINKG